MNAINNYLNRFKINNEKNNEEYIHIQENKNDSQTKEKLERNLLNQPKREKTEFQKEHMQKNLNNLNNLNSNICQKTKLFKKLNIDDVVDLIIDKPSPNDNSLEGSSIKIENNRKEKNKEITKLKMNPKYLVDKKFYKSDLEINDAKIIKGKITINSQIIEQGKEIPIKIEGNRITNKDKGMGNNNNKNSTGFVGTEYKTPFLNKTRYNLKRTLKFTNEDKNTNYVKNIETNSKNEAILSEIGKEVKTKKKIDSDNQSSGQKKILIEKETKINQANNKKESISNSKTNKNAHQKQVNRIRKDYSEVKAKVKKFVELCDYSEEDAKIENKDEDDSKTKKKVSTSNYVRLNMKGGYREKKLKRFKNIRKIKLERAKSYYKYKEKQMKNIDENYLGTGKNGLEEESVTENSVHESESEKETEIKRPKTYKEYMQNYQEYKKEKIPCFSEGYYLNEVIKNNSTCNQKENGIIENNYEIGNSCFTKNDCIITNKMKDLLLMNKNCEFQIDCVIKINRENLEKCLVSKQKFKSLDIKIVLEYDKHNQNIISEKIQKLIFDKNKDKVPIDNTEISNQKKEKIYKCNIQEINKDYHLKNVLEEVTEELKNLSDKDFEKLIFKNILLENFEYKDFKANQLETIINILNKRSSLLILPPGKGKSLVFQLCSLLLDGLVLFISPLIASISDQLINLPACISAASLTSFTNIKEKLVIMDGIKNKKIKILFITPERLAFENFKEFGELSLVVFDDVSNCCPLSTSFRSSYLTIKNLFKEMSQEFQGNTFEENTKKMDIVSEDEKINGYKKTNTFLLFANNTTNMIEKDICKFYEIKNENIFKSNLKIEDMVKISSSREDSKTKLKSLLKILKSKTFKNIGPVMVFCNSKKSVDTVRIFLFQNSFKVESYHSNMSELERQKIQTRFVNNDFDILVTTPSFSTVLSKKDIRFKILFELPPSVDILYQQIGNLSADGKEGFIHIFCDDDDYFNYRNIILQDLLDKIQIMKLVKYMFCLINNQKTEKSYIEKVGVKRNYSLAFENNFNCAFVDFNSNVENNNDLKLEEEDNSFKLDSNDLIRMKFDNDELNKHLPNKIAFNFSKATEICGIKKIMQIYLLNNIFESSDNQIKRKDNFEQKDIMDIDELNNQNNIVKGKLFGIGPSEINLRFFKRKPKELAEQEEKIKIILTNSREFSGGVHKFNLLNICNKINFSQVDLMNYLYDLQTKGDIGYEGKEESLFIFIEKFKISLNKLISSLAELNREIVNLSLTKLNTLYVLLRKFSTLNCDMLLSRDENSEIHILEQKIHFNDYQMKFKEQIEKYFEENNKEFNTIIPTINIDNEKEKNDIESEISSLIQIELKKNINITTIDIFHILFGISIENKMNYYSNPLWAKFKQYDLEIIYNIIENLIYRLKPIIFEKEYNLPNKKMQKL